MKKFKPELPKRRNLLSEAYAWERQAGKSLPTLAEVQAAYQAKMREDANLDPEEEGHVYEEPPYDEEDEDAGYMDEAAKPDFLDLDGDGDETESMKSAAADSTPHGNYINKSRAKSHLTKKDGIVHGINRSGKTVKLTSTSDVDNVDSDGKPEYTKFTIKSNDDLSESFNKRILGNLHGHEYILREAFKRK